MPEDGDVTGVGHTSINDEHIQAEEEEEERRRQQRWERKVSRSCRVDLRANGRRNVGSDPADYQI
jgi:hypothetical protein